MTGNCPKCKSTFYTPDPGNGGAGRNKCLGCGHIGQVVTFYPEPVHGEIRITHRTSDDGSSVVYTATQYLDRLHTETQPAPIRQYKDD